MLLIFQEENTQHLERSREGGREQRGFLAFPSGSGLGNLEEMPAEAGQALALGHWALGTPPRHHHCAAPFPAPSWLSGFLLSILASWSPSHGALPVWDDKSAGGDWFLDSFHIKRSLRANIDHSQSRVAFQPLLAPSWEE